MAGRYPKIDPATVAECQAKGMTQKQTATALDISLSGVQAYWQKSPEFGRPNNNAVAVARLVAEGKTDREISQELQIAVSTVNRHRRALIAK